jgi:hypothetical protein
MSNEYRKISMKRANFPVRKAIILEDRDRNTKMMMRMIMMKIIRMLMRN